MLTLFSIPKAFTGRFKQIQRNALASWVELHPDIDILLLGDDPGTAEAAKEFKVRHLPQVKTNAWNTPLVSSCFQLAREHARFDRLCYINADIILEGDAFKALEAALNGPPADQALVIGRRVNLDVDDACESLVLRQQLFKRARQHGQQGAATAIDYFIYPKGLYQGMPDFAIGRHYWDNWLVFAARQRGLALIDASESLLAVHQNHGYGPTESLTDSELRELPEVRLNKDLSGGYYNGLNLAHCNYEMIDGQCYPKLRKAMGTPAFLFSNLATRPWLFYISTRVWRALEVLTPTFLKRPFRWWLAQS